MIRVSLYFYPPQDDDDEVSTLTREFPDLPHALREVKRLAAGWPSGEITEDVHHILLCLCDSEHEYHLEERPANEEK